MTEKLQGTVIIAGYNNRFVVTGSKETIPLSYRHTARDFLIPERATSAEVRKGRDGYDSFLVPKEFRREDTEAENYLLLPTSTRWYVDWSKPTMEYWHGAIATVDRGRADGEGNPFVEEVVLLMNRDSSD